MEHASGIVVAVDVVDGNRVAWVDVTTTRRCRRCAAGRGCGAGLVDGAPRLRRIRTPLPRDSAVAVGETVSLSMPDRDLLRAAVLAYGWPLAAAAAGVTVAILAGAGDTMTALAALGGLFAGLVFARRRLSVPGCAASLTPRIVR